MPIYNFVIFLYGCLIRISAMRNEKAAQWVNGRKNWRNNLTEKLKLYSTDKRIWMHCASYGEFEQGRPLLEALRKNHPDHKLILSFFSPSGYEAFKNWQGVDVVCYLPLDSKQNANDFLRIVQPELAVFIKYEFWLHYLTQLKKNKIPNFLVSAVFKKHHPFFKWYGSIFRKSLTTFSEIFVQDEASGKLLEKININHYTVSGDTRFDRVLEVKQNFSTIALFESFCKGYKIVIAGSTWPMDEDLMMNTFVNLNRTDTKLIFVPHEVDARSISDLESRLKKKDLSYNLFTDESINKESKVLVVNTMGLLSKLYHYADLAYIGGGFNSGIHNCLEPAVFLKPLVFYGGDDYHKYNEALDLIDMKAAINIKDQSELESAIGQFLDDEKVHTEIEHKLTAYFKKNSGTSLKVLEKLSPFL